MRGPFNAVIREENVMELRETIKLGGGYYPWKRGEEAQKEKDGLEGVRKHLVKVRFSKYSFD
jgi:hypothetical protein